MVRVRTYTQETEGTGRVHTRIHAHVLSRSLYLSALSAGYHRMADLRSFFSPCSDSVDYAAENAASTSDNTNIWVMVVAKNHSLQ